MRRLPFQSVARAQALMVIAAVMFRLAELLAVTLCNEFVSKYSDEAPIRPGAIQVGSVGLPASVPVLPLPEESAAVVPPLSSRLQLAARPLVTSPASVGNAETWSELALSPPGLTAVTM